MAFRLMSGSGDSAVASKGARWYLDACLFISHLTGETLSENGIPRNQLVEAVFNKGSRGDVQLVTSTYGIVEVNGGKTLSSDPEIRRKATTIFTRSYIELVEVDRVIAERARQLIWDARAAGFKIDNDDMVHLATAIQEGCDAVLTWDRVHLMSLDGHFGIPIHLPEPGQLTLPGVS